MTIGVSALARAASLCFSVASLAAQQQAPATPLIAHDPYFSVWSTTEKLTDSDTTHWTGRQHRLTSLARIDGKTIDEGVAPIIWLKHNRYLGVYWCGLDSEKVRKALELL